MYTPLEALRLTRIAKAKLREVALALPLAKENRGFVEIHGNLLDSLLLLSDIERLLENTPEQEGRKQSTEGGGVKIRSTADDVIPDEIKKVERKLPRWASNPTQINAKILSLFLKLQDDNHVITEQFLMEQYGNHAEFLRNYNQMKTISTKNHAKVFDVIDGNVTIWEPVLDAVLTFKKKIAHYK